MPSKDSNDASNTVFLGSFNMNGSPLSLSHARTWLQVGIETEQSNHVSARNADLVILSLQECPTSPTPSTSPSDCFDPCIMTYNDAHYGNVDEVANVLNETLSVEHKLVADLAMGEPPSPPGKGPKHDMWYGFIRLIVYAKGEVLKGISHENSSPSIPVFCPCGNKTNSSVLGKGVYKKNLSPDKGGVCLVIPFLSTIICSLHLAGTNQYNVAEEYFDTLRINQLNTIHSRLVEECVRFKERDHNTNEDFSGANYRKIILGDLNFRCEKFCNVHEGDKARGGQDFKAVHDLITKGKPDEIQNLFCESDRLVRLLQSNSAERNVPLLKDVTDLIATYNYGYAEGRFRDKVKILLPTFTMKFKKDGIEKQKVYSDKRTPAWPDRLLVTRNLFSSKRVATIDSNPLVKDIESIKKVGSCPTVTSSDHVPVYSYLESISFP